MDIDSSEDEDQARLLIDGYLRVQPQLSQESALLDITKLIHLFFYIPGIVTLDTILTRSATPEPMQIDDTNELTANTNKTDSDTLKKANTNLDKLLNSMEPSVLLIDGYIRELTDSNNLSPSDLILDLIQSFYRKMKGTTFVWEITDEKKLLTKILSSNKNTANHNNKSFDSDVFDTVTFLKQSKSDMPICANCCKVSNKLSRCTACKQVFYCSRNCQYTHWDKHHANVCASGHPPLLDYNPNNSIFDHDDAAEAENKMDDLSLKWYIKLYPNGSDFDSLGQIELELILVSLPSIFSCVSFIYQIYCHELNLYWCEQIEFSNDQTRHFLSESVNGESSIKLLNDLLILFETNKLQRLRFFATFNIIRCGMKRSNNNKNKYKYNPMYFFDERKYLKTVDIDSIGDFLMKNDDFKFKWNINEDALNALCCGVNMDHSRCVISDLYFNQWALSLHHNKIKIAKETAATEQKNEDTNIVAVAEDTTEQSQDVITIGLELCSLPSNISSFVAQIKLFCLQFSCQWSIVKKFSYSNRYYSDLCVNNIFDFAHLKHLSIFADIKIIEVFDEYGDEQQLKIKQIKQKYKQDILKKHNKVIDTYNIRFKAFISGDLNMRYHYQNIGLMNDELDQISVEELRCQDERNTNFALYRTNAVPMIIAANIINKGHNSYHKRGTYGYHFQPFQQKSNSKRYKTFYYQHICVGIDSPFKQKSCEELQFEDRFPLNRINVNSNNNKWSWNNNKNGGAAAAAEVESDAESVFKNGLSVEVNGLRGNMSKFNGKKGKIISFDESNKKYKIKLNDNKVKIKLNVKKHNLCFGTEENKLKNKKDWKFEYNDTNKWSWNNKKDDKKEEDKKEEEDVINGADKIQFKELKNKMESITNKLEKMRSLMHKIYHSALTNENEETKNEIKRMFDDFDGKHFNNFDEKKTNEETKKMELKNWLQNELGLSEYYEVFIEEGIDDLQTLKLVNYQQLKEIGIKKLGHRIKILHKLKDI